MYLDPFHLISYSNPLAGFYCLLDSSFKLGTIYFESNHSPSVVTDQHPLLPLPLLPLQRRTKPTADLMMASEKSYGRSTAACRPCHQRKRKCDVILRGAPCSACITDGRSSEDCFVRPNKRHVGPSLLLSSEQNQS